MSFIKFVRIFLLILIVIGIGLLVTQKMWVPKVVDMILGPEMAVEENTMNPENKTTEKVENQEIQSQRELYCNDEFAENATEGLPNEVKAIMDRINTCSFLAGEVGG